MNFKEIFDPSACLAGRQYLVYAAAESRPQVADCDGTTLQWIGEFNGRGGRLEVFWGTDRVFELPKSLASPVPAPRPMPTQSIPGQYIRVIPRDLFNEAHLLKCLGAITLLRHYGKIRINYEHHEPERGFVIEQDPDDGSIFVANLHWSRIASPGRREPVHLANPMNSRRSYPLLFSNARGEAGAPVFTDHSATHWEMPELTPEFLALVGS